MIRSPDRRRRWISGSVSLNTLCRLLGLLSFRRAIHLSNTAGWLVSLGLAKLLDLVHGHHAAPSSYLDPIQLPGSLLNL